LRLLAEVEQFFRHGVAGQVGALDDFEADIGAVADDEGDAAVGLGRARGKNAASTERRNYRSGARTWVI
jgi:hypothetical protein